MEDRASRRTIAVTRAPLPSDVTAVEALASLTVLRGWDRARARAWRDGDVAALRALYVPGSRAGDRDAAMLRRWLGRGLRVDGMAMQVLSARLGSCTDRRIVLVVTDRLAGPVAVDRAGHRWSLPQDEASTHRLEFRRTAGRWLLASVSQPDRRPVRTTSATPRSANS